MRLGKSKPLFVFYILLAYVLLQFSWWTYLMLELNTESYYLQHQLMSNTVNNPVEQESQNLSLSQKLHKRTIMIVGESSVFILLLILGVLRVRSVFKNEQALAQQQKNFLLSATHELKSPIASIKLQLETIIHRDLEKGLQHQMLLNAISDADRLNGLAEKVLLATKIENSSFLLEKQPFDFSRMLSSMLSKHQQLSKHIYESKVEQNIEINADGLALESIVLNLLENAEKYSPVGSKIVVGLYRKENHIIFSVADEGPGIAETEKHKVFTKFYRVGNEETRKTKGTGLGLYIVNYIALQHKASIEVKRNTPQGTVFELKFTS
jgi:two-component system phosphate regulon sensor histidine kinase PhoR